MDWSKAKSILIIALVITNLLIASMYFGQLREERLQSESAARSAAEYVSSRGVTLDCAIPTKEIKLPVLFVSFSDDAKSTDLRYKNYPVEISGEGYGVPVSYSTGEAVGRVGSASSALVSFVSGLDSVSFVPPEGLIIRDISLVYWINRSEFSSSVEEDTAIPAWKFTTSYGVYYVNAFSD